MPELTSPQRELLGRGVGGLDDPGEPAVAVAHDPPVRAGVGGLEGEDGRGRPGGAVRLDERADRLGPERRDVAVEDEDVAAEALERRARAADGVAGAERLLLHGDLDALEKVARLRRGDDDEPLDAGLARGLDDPVDHPPAEQRVQVLRRRALHARADSAGHHDCCELVCHVREKWLGRQDSNLGSRDQNPLPYHLATPQGHGSLPAVEPEERERDDGARDEAEDQQPLEEDREQDEHDGEQLRDDEDPQGLPEPVRAAVPAEPPGDP